jgi:hypothetical protein
VASIPQGLGNQGAWDWVGKKLGGWSLTAVESVLDSVIRMIAISGLSRTFAMKGLVTLAGIEDILQALKAARGYRDFGAGHRCGKVYLLLQDARCKLDSEDVDFSISIMYSYWHS